MAALTAILITGGLVLDARRRRAEHADIMIRGDTISHIGASGSFGRPGGVAEFDAKDRWLIPGLINAQTHGHGHLGKGLGDRWTLELLLNASPALNGNRSLEDMALATLLGGLDMIRNGTTACYDLFVEFPFPTLAGLTAAARAYARAGVRALPARMIAAVSMNCVAAASLRRSFPK